jgi:GMP synthase (glutamine-hydrolysing)
LKASLEIIIPANKKANLAIKYIFIMGERVLMRIFVVNNYGQFNHLIGRSIRDRVESKMISNQTPPEEIEADGLILGGGPTLERAGRCADYIKNLDIPILGICLGMQIMGTTYGGQVAPGTIGGYAEVQVDVIKENDILKGFPRNFKTWASHADQVIRLPQEFEILARSNVCEIEAMKHVNRPLYGVQWHPEVVHTEHGQELLGNFIELCKK